MICKCFHPFIVFSFCCYFLGCAEAFWFDAVPFAFAFGVRSKKAATKTDIKEPTICVFFCEFYGLGSYIQVFNPF